MGTLKHSLLIPTLSITTLGVIILGWVMLGEKGEESLETEKISFTTQGDPTTIVMGTGTFLITTIDEKKCMTTEIPACKKRFWKDFDDKTCKEVTFEVDCMFYDEVKKNENEYNDLKSEYGVAGREEGDIACDNHLIDTIDIGSCGKWFWKDFDDTTCKKKYLDVDCTEYDQSKKNPTQYDELLVRNGLGGREEGDIACDNHIIDTITVYGNACEEKDLGKTVADSNTKGMCSNNTRTCKKVTRDGKEVFLREKNLDTRYDRTGKTEICDGSDNNCNGQIDEGYQQKEYLRDFDGDGWGNLNMKSKACIAPPGHVSKPGDCDDLDKAVYPGASEVCDLVDNNCNIQIDENKICCDNLAESCSEEDKEVMDNKLNNVIKKCIDNFENNILLNFSVANDPLDDFMPYSYYSNGESKYKRLSLCNYNYTKKIRDTRQKNFIDRYNKDKTGVELTNKLLKAAQNKSKVEFIGGSIYIDNIHIFPTKETDLTGMNNLSIELYMRSQFVIKNDHKKNGTTNRMQWNLENNCSNVTNQLSNGTSKHYTSKMYIDKLSEESVKELDGHKIVIEIKNRIQELENNLYLTKENRICLSQCIASEIIEYDFSTGFNHSEEYTKTIAEMISCGKGRCGNFAMIAQYFSKILGLRMGNIVGIAPTGYHQINIVEYESSKDNKPQRYIMEPQGDIGYSNFCKVYPLIKYN